MKSLKIIMSLVVTLFMSLSVGTGLEMAVGFDAITVSKIAFGGSIVLGAARAFLPAGLMFDVVINTAYSGEVLAKLLVKAMTGNELVAGGHIRVEPNASPKFYIPRLKTGTMLQKRKEQPVEEDGKGDFNTDEKVLEPKEFMAFTTFNPRSFEKLWKKYQPDGELVFRDLPTHVQSQLLEELAKVVNFELGGHFINGEYAETGDDKLFDGVVLKVTNDADTVKVTTNIAPLTRSNIIDNGFKQVYDLIPDELIDAPNLKFFCSRKDFALYDEARTLLATKGIEHTKVSEKIYKDIQIVPLAKWPKDVIIATVGSMDLDSNLWAGVDHVNDVNAIQIAKLTNAGERYFFKMLMKADTEVVFGEHCIEYDAR